MRKIFACLLALMMLTVAVNAQAPFVEDTSGILSDAEVKNLESQFSQLYKEYGVTAAVVTMPSLGGETTDQAAKNAYQSNGYGNDGMMLFICEEEGQWYIYTRGLCSQVVTETMLAELSQTMTAELQAGNHYRAIEAFYQVTSKPVIDTCNDNAAKAEQAADRNGKLLIVGLLGGLMAGVAVALVLKKLSQKPLPKKEEPKPEPETVPPVFEVEIPEIQDVKEP